MTPLSTGSGSCLESTVNPRRSGRPASMSVASCRVKIISVLGLMVFFFKKGMLILISFLAADCFAGDLVLSFGPLPSSEMLLGK
jgi:hypothetical protein